MCKKCIEKLVQCYEFQTLCRECDKKLHCCIAKNEDHSYCKAAPEKVKENAEILVNVSTEISTPEDLIVDQNTIEHLPSKTSTESEPNPDTSKNVQESYTCPTCPNVSYTKHTFNQHMRSHKDSDELICRVC